jgi:sarcosine oxidase subunit gamma
VRGRALVSVIARSGQSGPLRVKVRERFGLDLPQTPRIEIGPVVSFLWAGHEQWFALAEETAISLLHRAIKTEISAFAAVTDQTDARAWVRISGPAARNTLAKLAPIDFHPRVFKPHDTALTTMEHITAQVTQLDDVPTYEISVPRSFAESFWLGLIQAASEFGISISSSSTEPSSTL